MVDPSSVNPPKDEKMYSSMSASHRIYGKVIKTVGTREEAERLKGAQMRVMQVTGDLPPGRWISQADLAIELVRGLPKRA